MKVRQLITALQEMDQNAQVLIYSEAADTFYLFRIKEVGNRVVLGHLGQAPDFLQETRHLGPDQ